MSVLTLIELKKALLANRDDIAAALESAVAELELCRAKCMELEGLIERGRLVLGVEDPKVEPLTLHAAMEVVLREHGDGLSAPELARELNKRHLYRPRKGGPVEPDRSMLARAPTKAYSRGNRAGSSSGPSLSSHDENPWADGPIATLPLTGCGRISPVLAPRLARPPSAWRSDRTAEAALLSGSGRDLAALYASLFGTRDRGLDQSGDDDNVRATWALLGVWAVSRIAGPGSSTLEEAEQWFFGQKEARSPIASQAGLDRRFTTFCSRSMSQRLRTCFRTCLTRMDQVHAARFSGIRRAPMPDPRSDATGFSTRQGTSPTS